MSANLQLKLKVIEQLKIEYNFNIQDTKQANVKTMVLDDCHTLFMPLDMSTRFWFIQNGKSKLPLDEFDFSVTRDAYTLIEKYNLILADIGYELHGYQGELENVGY